MREIVSDELVDVAGEKVTANLESIFGSREGSTKLLEAGRRTDACFQEECEDRDLRGAFSLSFGDLPSVQQAISELPDALGEHALTTTLRETLARDFPALTSKQLDTGIDLYTDCLRRALLPLEDYSFRIIGGAVLRIERKLETLTQEQRDAFARLEAQLSQLKVIPPRSTLSNVPQLPPASKVALSSMRSRTY